MTLREGRVSDRTTRGAREVTLPRPRPAVKDRGETGPGPVATAPGRSARVGSPGGLPSPPGPVTRPPHPPSERDSPTDAPVSPQPRPDRPGLAAGPDRRPGRMGPGSGPFGPQARPGGEPRPDLGRLAPGAPLVPGLRPPRRAGHPLAGPRPGRRVHRRPVPQGRARTGRRRRLLPDREMGNLRARRGRLPLRGHRRRQDDRRSTRTTSAWPGHRASTSGPRGPSGPRSRATGRSRGSPARPSSSSRRPPKRGDAARANRDFLAALGRSNAAAPGRDPPRPEAQRQRPGRRDPPADGPGSPRPAPERANPDAPGQHLRPRPGRLLRRPARRAQGRRHRHPPPRRADPPAGPAPERRRPPQGIRPGPGGHLRHGHGPLRPPRRPGSRRHRPDLQRRQRRRERDGLGRRAGRGPRLAQRRGPPQAEHPLRRLLRRGEGAARLPLLRPPPDHPGRPDRGRRQPRTGRPGRQQRRRRRPTGPA